MYAPVIPWGSPAPPSPPDSWLSQNAGWVLIGVFVLLAFATAGGDGGKGK
jgi:hypothetical protein